MTRNGIPFYLRSRGLAGLDLFIILGGLFLGFYWKFGYPIEDPNLQDFQRAYLALVPLRFFAGALLGLYRTDLEETILDLAYRVFWVHAIIAGMEWLILLGLRNYYLPDMGISRQLVLVLWSSWFVLSVAGRAVLNRLRLNLVQQVYRTLLIGRGKVDQVLYGEIEELAGMGYSVAGFAGDDLSLPGDRFPVLGKLEQLGWIIDQYQVRQVVIVDDYLARERFTSLLKHCEPRGVLVRILPSLYEIMIGRVRIARAGGIPLVEVATEPLTLTGRGVKRTLDIIASAAALLCIFWVWLIICLLVRLDQSGPILDRLPCLGRGGRIFHLYRFRVTASGKSGEDERLSPVGYILKRLDFERLPQLLNVLKGDLSLVGPRPMTPDFFEAIIQEEPLYRRCLTVKPGVTGLAQIHGQSHHLTSKLRYDLSYINNLSILLDLKILFQSFSVLMTGRKIKA